MVLLREKKSSLKTLQEEKGIIALILLPAVILRQGFLEAEMASCLPYPIPNPSRPGESLKAAPWHLLAISLKSLSPPMARRKSRKANKLKVRCFASQELKQGERIHVRQNKQGELVVEC